MTILVESFGSWSAVANDQEHTALTVPDKRGCVIVGWQAVTSIANPSFFRDGVYLTELQTTGYNIYKFGLSYQYNPTPGTLNLTSYAQSGGGAYQSGVAVVLSGVLENSHSYANGGYTSNYISNTGTPNPDGILLNGGFGKMESDNPTWVTAGISLGMVGANIVGQHETRGGACYVYGTGAPVTGKINFPAGSPSGAAAELTFEPDIYPSGVPIFY